jgi:Holliday junction resolvase RusA-like endonuclease
MDAIEQSGVIRDDKFIRDVRIRRAYHHRDEPDRITIRIQPVSERELKFLEAKDER